VDLSYPFENEHDENGQRRASISCVGGRKAEDPFKGIEGWAGFLPPYHFRRSSTIPTLYRRGCVCAFLSLFDQHPHTAILVLLASSGAIRKGASILYNKRTAGAWSNR
jgi:hypothetical protein